jgi:ferredoxin
MHWVQAVPLSQHLEAPAEVFYKNQPHLLPVQVEGKLAHGNRVPPAVVWHFCTAREPPLNFLTLTFRPPNMPQKQLRGIITMLANFGYKDGAGEFFISVDTDKCTGCGDCVTACPMKLFVVVDEDPFDPLNENPIAIIPKDKTNKLKYDCGPCKSSSEPLPCVKACTVGAIAHSW